MLRLFRQRSQLSRSLASTLLVAACAGGGDATKQSRSISTASSQTSPAPSNGEIANTEPTSGGYWTAAAPLLGGNDPRRLFVVEQSWWIVRTGTPGVSDQHWSRDAGKSWLRFSTHWRGPNIADSTFWFLGLGLDGAPLARWSYPDSCSECTNAGAPGSAGDTLLLRYDSGTDAWQPLDTAPKPFGEVRDVARSAAPLTSALWLFGPTTLYRFGGVGDWQTVALPDGSAQINDVFVERDGSVLLVADDKLYVRSAGADTWQSLSVPNSDPLPRPVDVRTVRGDNNGNRYLYAMSAVSGLQLYRSVSGTWQNITPQLPNAPASSRPGDWLLGVTRGGAVFAATVLSPTPDTAPSSLMVRLSLDEGKTWLDRTSGLSMACFPQDITFASDERAYFAARDVGTLVWHSDAPFR